MSFSVTVFPLIDNSGIAKSLPAAADAPKNAYLGDVAESPSTQWRVAAASALMKAGMVDEGDAFAQCGDLTQFRQVEICTDDIDHDPRIIPYTCHKRYCPDCESREQARKLLRYIPAIYDAIALERPGYTLKKFELTTPYNLAAPDAPNMFRLCWKWVALTLNDLFLKLRADYLSPEEKRRGRIDLRKHHIGVIASAEFGEDNKHLHFHLIIYSPFIPKDDLTETWRDVTNGECYITWIKKIETDEIEDQIKEQVKYVTKFTSLDPALIPNLAAVLQGQHRTRLYGIFAKLPSVEREPNECRHCSAQRAMVHVVKYFHLCRVDEKPVDDKILNAYIDSGRSLTSIFLDLKHGNCVGEPPEAKPPPKPPPIQESVSEPPNTSKKRFTINPKTWEVEYL